MSINGFELRWSLHQKADERFRAAIFFAVILFLIKYVTAERFGFKKWVMVRRIGTAYRVYTKKDLFCKKKEGLKIIHIVDFGWQRTTLGNLRKEKEVRVYIRYVHRITYTYIKGVLS